MIDSRLRHVTHVMSSTRSLVASGVGGCSVFTGGCGGAQSALAPASHEAAQIATLFWGMAIGALVVWACMLFLAYICVRADPERHTTRRERLLIVGGGVIVPIVVTAVLLIISLAMIPPLVTRPPLAEPRDPRVVPPGDGAISESSR